MKTECKASSSEEPGAGIPHAGICAGGARQRASLPRYILWDGTWHYVWDAENRLIGVSNDLFYAHYQYDHQGRRVQASAWTLSPNPEYKGDWYVYDGWNLVRDEENWDNIAFFDRAFVWGLDLSGTLQGAGGIGGLLAIASPSMLSETGVQGSYAFDGNGNVTDLVGSYDDTPIEAHYTYDPFGRLSAESSDDAWQWLNPFHFSTKYHDETGLYYYGYRWYDAELGRWLSRDPIGEEGAINLFIVQHNNCNDEIDMLGLFSHMTDCLRHSTELFSAESEARNILIRWLSFLISMPTQREIQDKLFTFNKSHIPAHKWSEVSDFNSNLGFKIVDLARAMIANTYSAKCACAQTDCFEPSTRAQVNNRFRLLRGNSTEIVFCPAFFKSDINNSERASIIIHELSHMVLSPHVYDDVEWVPVSPLRDNLGVGLFYERLAQSSSPNNYYITLLTPVEEDGMDPSTLIFVR